MKKILITLFATILLASGCTKETDSPISEDIQSGGIIRVNLSVPVNQDTKTSLGDKNGSSYPVLWGASDVITLNGVEATSFTRGNGNTTATATFRLALLSSPYNFLYCGVPGQSNQVSFPTTQSYISGGFDPAAMPMYASLASRSDNVTFSHVGALLKFSFTGNKKIDSVTLTATDGTKSLSGNFTIGATAGILNGTLTPASGGASLIYSFGGHKQLSDEPFVFYIAIPAGTYEGGITLDVVDNSSGHMTVTVMDSDATKTITAGRVREFENVVYSPDKVTNLKQIYNEATFLQFVDAVAAGNKTLNARLTQNASTLNLSSIASSLAPIEDYKGVFDGNGKTISGLTKPLFADLMGVVKNLTLNSTIEATDAEDLNWGIFAKRVIPSTEIDDIAGLQNCTALGSITWTPSSIVENNCQIGGLVGNNKGGSITGCTNQATVTFANNGVNNSGESSIGGVVGRSQKGGDLKTQGDISNCTNIGTVVCDANFDSNIYIGGVLGFQVEKAESIRGCTNSGTVKATENASTTKRLHIGGVIGLGKGAMESCSNLSDGVVTTEACNVGGYVCQGGVVGRMTNPSDTYTGLSNAGTLNVEAVGSNNAYIGGVVGLCNEGAAVTDFTNTGTVNCTASHKGEMYMGGIAGCSGVLSGTNTGNINVSGLVGREGKKICVGGVVGQNADVVTAHNEGDVILTSGSQTNHDTFIGGIVGRATANVTSCTNSGLVSNASPQKKSGQYVEMGGIVGYSVSPAIISNCENTGEVINTANSAGYIYIGGIMGEGENDLTSCENSGAVSNSGVASTELCLGGVAGVANGIVFDSCQNEGELSVTEESGGIRVGGIAGKIIGTMASGFNDCDNDGNISIANEGSNTSQDHITVGGIAGRGSAQVLYYSCTNNGYIRLDMSGTSNKAGVRAGGIFGDNVDKDNDCTECENKADIEVYYQTEATPLMIYVVGGIAGRMSAPVGDGQDGSEINTCTNSGDLYVISNRAVMGGIAGQMIGGRIIDCENTKEVRYRYNRSTSSSFVVVGGIAGDVWDKAEKITGCTNSGSVISKSLTGSSNRANYAGGIAGWIEDDTSCIVSGCENTGDVTCNTCSDHANGAAMAGGIIGYKESYSTDINNINRGNVLALAVKNRASAAGGTVGALHHGTLEACYNYGTIEAGEKSSAYNDSNSAYNAGRAGSIVGFYHSGVDPYEDCDGTITKCYVGGAVKSRTSGGSLITITSSNYGSNIVGIGSDPTDCFFVE